MKKNLFNTIKVDAPSYNTFDLSHDFKFSAVMGKLIPTLALECVPGDNIKLTCDMFIRFAPMIAPIMHRINATMHFFFVPNRLSWDEWETFISNEPTGGIPNVSVTGGLTADQKKFMDYMGVPPNTLAIINPRINALPFCAYQRIWWDWYRDENLQPESTYPMPQLIDGDNDGQVAVLTAMRNRAYEHDYFTAALPFAQKGAAVQLPIGEVILDPAWTGSPHLQQAGGATAPAGNVTAEITPQPLIQVGGVGPAFIPYAYDPDGTLITNPTTINEFRRALKLQQWLEINARSGTRYNELIYGHFAERVKDYRLQRAEYITGVKNPVIISEVLNTTGETGGLPQGNMAGHGVSVGNGYAGSYHVPEHGYIIGIMSVMPLPAYQQGIPRHYLRTDPLNWYWPSFAHIGEQEITNDEIYAYTATGQDVWGYIPRYAEYKYMPSRVAGDFRTTLDFWHLGRIFSGLPTLSEDFLTVLPSEVERIFAVQAGDDNLWCHVVHKIIARRKMPVFGTPML